MRSTFLKVSQVISGKAQLHPDFGPEVCTPPVLHPAYKRSDSWGWVGAIL